MADLRVLLLEGFDDDDVDLELGSGETRSLTAVTTSLLTDLAAEIVLECDAPTTLQVSVPERSLEATREVGPDQSVIVRVRDGVLDIAETPEGFGLA